MLTIVVPKTQLWDDETGHFVYLKNDVTLNMEHSLIAISKWESMYKKAFLTDKPKTRGEMVDYIKCMTINKNVPELAWRCLTKENMSQIEEYIKDPHTATCIKQREGEGRGGRGDVLTSEYIYYLMTAAQIPWEAQTWHINRLLTLIRVYALKQEKPKKSRPGDVNKRNAALNAARRAKSGSRG